MRLAPSGKRPHGQDCHKFLFENEILPTPALMYEENQQALVETIYTQNNIYDNILENQMEKAKCRNEIVTVILMLLQKKRIVML